VIVDNAPDGMSGEWDWDMLANEFDVNWLNDLGLAVPETIDRDGDYRAGTSPWERMNDDGSDGVMFMFGSIHAKISSELYVKFFETVPDTDIQEYITKVLQDACSNH